MLQNGNLIGDALSRFSGDIQRKCEDIMSSAESQRLESIVASSRFVESSLLEFIFFALPEALTCHEPRHWSKLIL